MSVAGRQRCRPDANAYTARHPLRGIRMKSAFILLMLVASSTAGIAGYAKPDHWSPVRFLLGNWQGEAQGEPGKGTVERSYELVLGDKFIEERNTSRYEAATPGKQPEVHLHRSFLSYDKTKKRIMLRQFHAEGFINLYEMNPATSKPGRLVFDSVSFENFSNEWKARETYEVLSSDEFTETFELAEPGKDFQVYSRNHFTRKK
jgi:hypothetical protein